MRHAGILDGACLRHVLHMGVHFLQVFNVSFTKSRVLLSLCPEAYIDPAMVCGPTFLLYTGRLEELGHVSQGCSWEFFRFLKHVRTGSQSLVSSGCMRYFGIDIHSHSSPAICEKLEELVSPPSGLSMSGSVCPFQWDSKPFMLGGT